MSTYNSRAAVQSIMAIAESENSKPGRVTMPKVFLGVGIFELSRWALVYIFLCGLKR